MNVITVGEVAAAAGDAYAAYQGLQADEVVNMGQHAMHMSLVKEGV